MILITLENGTEFSVTFHSILLLFYMIRILKRDWCDVKLKLMPITEYSTISSIHFNEARFLKEKSSTIEKNCISYY